MQAVAERIISFYSTRTNGSCVLSRAQRTGPRSDGDETSNRVILD